MLIGLFYRKQITLGYHLILSGVSYISHKEEEDQRAWRRKCQEAQEPIELGDEKKMIESLLYATDVAEMQRLLVFHCDTAHTLNCGGQDRPPIVWMLESMRTDKVRNNVYH